MTKACRGSSAKSLTILILFILAGCGFSPMYGAPSNDNEAAVESKLAMIAISRIPERQGQLLRNRLIRRLHGGQPNDLQSYKLEISPIREKRTELDITETSDTTRAQLRLTTQIALKRMGKSQSLLNRRIQAVTSYNVLDSQFTTRVSEQNARRNAIAILAERIERQLALYFSHNTDTGDGA